MKTSAEDRKLVEAEFHDRRESLRQEDPEEYARITRNQKFYSINRSSKEFMEGWFRERCRAGVKVLDFCCGTGLNSLFLAACGADVTGIDISQRSIDAARKRLEENGLGRRANFIVGDAEATGFPEKAFDLILCNGVLHHLDVNRAFTELSRILKPGGHVFCVEALAHNPAFQLYRRLTPHMRTSWEIEHILSRREIETARKSFASISLHFFHLFELLAVPFRGRSFIFEKILPFLRGVDRIVLSLPYVRWWAWQCIFILSEPRKA